MTALVTGPVGEGGGGGDREMTRQAKQPSTAAVGVGGEGKRLSQLLH